MLNELEIHYIHHSCFIIKIMDSTVLFDFYNDSLESKEYITEIFKNSKHKYIFSSHSHSDHYHQSIFDFENQFNNINYILSHDIKLTKKNDNYHSLFSNNELILENIEIRSFGSTDAGVSYLINLHGINIFHAGDLNWWDWGQEDTEEEKIAMEKRFKRIIKNIADTNLKIDICFFPVDPRLKKRTFVGADYFIEQLAPKYLIPMHLWDKFEICKKLKEHTGYKTTEIVLYNKKLSKLDF
ncbi:MAG: MBL fold metallo-hydrolase [Fusobacteriaceae bacterium]